MGEIKNGPDKESIFVFHPNFGGISVIGVIFGGELVDLFLNFI